ncbi:MAG: N-6 DNA methylase [Nitrospira sp.]|nr:N-6 DNA methylase [Nitrospira sp.]
MRHRGLLISAYKHILRTHTDAQGNSTLTPDEKGRLAQNFKGYDISPDMVRLSLVNLYLHGFTDPHIHEYDTLTSQDRWNEYADVILANPPFNMSDWGGDRVRDDVREQARHGQTQRLDRNLTGRHARKPDCQRPWPWADYFDHRT